MAKAAVATSCKPLLDLDSPLEGWPDPPSELTRVPSVSAVTRIVTRVPSVSAVTASELTLEVRPSCNDQDVKVFETNICTPVSLHACHFIDQGFLRGMRRPALEIPTSSIDEAYYTDRGVRLKYVMAKSAKVFRTCFH